MKMLKTYLQQYLRYNIPRSFIILLVTDVFTNMATIHHFSFCNFRPRTVSLAGDTVWFVVHGEGVHEAKGLQINVVCEENAEDFIESG